ASRLPEDPVIRADIRTRISREIDGKNGLSGAVLTKGGRDDNLVEKRKKPTPPPTTNRPGFLGS
ncbi:hypothetical protein, partial [Mesorhizobium sp.]